MKLKIADDLALPLEAVTEKFAWLGRTGSGKSYGAMKLAEEMDRARAQFVVLDPVGVWYGLRLAADGKAPGLEIPVLGGLRGDIPLEPASGALIANLVVDRGASMILDVSQFESDSAKARFAHDFADRFFFRKKASPSAVHLFIDEAQEFVPQNPQREEARMLHVFTRLLKLGRNFGIGASLLSQRPQEVNKKALNLAEVLFAFQLTGPQERKTVDGWIADKGIDEDIAGELPKLAIGHPHVWSPAWLQISRVVHIAERWTFDASSTPKAGKVAEARDLTPIDLEKLRTAMVATIEKAKAEDPKLLRAEIAKLKAELAKKPAASPATIEVEKIVEKPVLNNGQLKKTEKVIERTEALGQKLLAEAGELRRLIAPAFAPQAKAAVIPKKAAFIPPKPEVITKTANVIPESGIPITEFAVTKATQKVLDSIALWKALGFEPIDRKKACLVAGLSPKASTFGVYIGMLLKNGYLETSAAGLALTDLGNQQANHPDVEPTAESLYAQVRTLLGQQELKVFDAIYEIYPNAILRDDLADKVGLSKTASTLGVYLGASSSIGLVENVRGEGVRAAAWLFP